MGRGFDLDQQLVVFAVLSLALVFLMERLAESTSLIHSDAPHVRVPIWVPVLGVVTCLVMIGSALLL